MVRRWVCFRFHPSTLWVVGALAVAWWIVSGGLTRAWWKVYDRALPVRILEAGVAPRPIVRGEEGVLTWDAPRADRVEIAGPEGLLFRSDQQVGAYRFRAGREATLTVTAYRLREVGGSWVRAGVQHQRVAVQITAPPPVRVRELRRVAAFRMATPVAKRPTLPSPPARRARQPGSPAPPKDRRQLASLDTPRPPVALLVLPDARRTPPLPSADTEKATPPRDLPPESRGGAVTHASIEGDAAPLMIHVLAVYCRLHHGSGDAGLRALRARGWRFEDLAMLCLIADRSRRPLDEIAHECQEGRAWAEVARERNIALAPGDSARLLRRAVEDYCVLGAGSIRDLEERGWTLGDVLVAGNLFFRSNTGFWEIVDRRNARQEWTAIARDLGVSPEQISQPIRRRR